MMSIFDLRTEAIFMINHIIQENNFKKKILNNPNKEVKNKLIIYKQTYHIMN